MAKTFEELLDALNESDVRDEADNLSSALVCAETCETLKDLKTNLLEAKAAAARFITHINDVLDE